MNMYKHNYENSSYMVDPFGILKFIKKKIEHTKIKQDYKEIYSRTRSYKDLGRGTNHLEEAIDKQIAEWELRGEDRLSLDPFYDVEGQAARVVANRLQVGDIKKVEFKLKNKKPMSEEETASYVDTFLEKQAMDRIKNYEKNR